MFRLRWIVIPLWAACIAGAVVISALSLGLPGWAPFGWGAAIGLTVGVPVGILNTRWLRNHPRWGDGHRPTMRPDPKRPLRSG